MRKSDSRREEAIRASYDSLPYASLPWRVSHPVWQGTLAALYGLDPVPPDSCRVLEIGCATGGNLIPMAAAYPQSEFIGVDLSSVQIDAGRRVVQTLGLRNIELLDMSLVDIDGSFGELDYIIAHGVYSWVPEAVQSALLDLCGQRLSSRGLAFVSYNTYPGWHQRQMVREMLVEHTRSVPDLGGRVQEASRLLEFLSEEMEGRKEAFTFALHDVLDQVREADAYYFAHEYLSEDNRPIYFRQFTERAAMSGLRYVADANHPLMHLDNLPPDKARRLLSFGDDRIAVEQSLDYLRGRLFRQSILCRAERDVRWVPDSSLIPKMHLAANVKPESEKPNLDSEEFEVFVDADRLTVRISHPLAKAALLVLGEVWPRALPFPALAAAAGERLSPTTAGEAVDPAICAGVLGIVWQSGVLELQAWPYPLADALPDRPIASPHARYEAVGSRMVTNLCHERVELADDIVRRTLTLLDGTRSPADIKAELGMAEGETDAAIRILAESALLGSRSTPYTSRGQP